MISLVAYYIIEYRTHSRQPPSNSSYKSKNLQNKPIQIKNKKNVLNKYKNLDNLVKCH